MLSFSEFTECVRTGVSKFKEHWLNQAQEQAVSASPSPPVFIVAGPGSGKTTVLALRVLKLILVDDFSPKSIMATTFTRKAATELRSRILSWGFYTIQRAVEIAKTSNDNTKIEWLTSIDINGVITGTLDAISEEMLREDRQPREIIPTVIENLIAKSLMRRHVIFKENRYTNPQLTDYLKIIDSRSDKFNIKLNICHSFAQRVLNDGINLELYSKQGEGTNILSTIVKDYLQHLKENSYIDFSMLEAEILDRLQTNKLLEFCQNLKALLVDEFQDTNFLQERIYYEICRRTGAALTVVGDDDQSIFRFRGATVEIFANFSNRIKDYLGEEWNPVRYDLVDNYRSTPRIIAFYNHFISGEQDYISARLPNKRPCIPASSLSLDPSRNIPVLGMFRSDREALGSDLVHFLIDIFRNEGRIIRLADGTNYSIQSSKQSDLGDSVLLTYSARELANGGRKRLPLIIRELLEENNINVFNPRGRELRDINEVSRCLGLMLQCIDPECKIQHSITTLTRNARDTFELWRSEALGFIDTNPSPGGLSQFIQDWGSRTTHKNSSWPSEWPLLELLFTIITWIPFFQQSPEGQIYLECIARTIAGTGQVSSYHGNILSGSNYDTRSIQDLIREVFEPIAEGSVDVDEDIMSYIPRNYFPIMTIHQAKGLEFPLTIVDVGSEFSRNHHLQRRLRFPENGDSVHIIEDQVAQFTPIGEARTMRSQRQRAFDDLRRLYYVAKSRPQNLLLILGLTQQLRENTTIRSVALGDCIYGNRIYNFESYEEFNIDHPDNTIVLI